MTYLRSLAAYAVGLTITLAATFLFIWALSTYPTAYQPDPGSPVIPALLPEARPATPVQVTDADLDRTFGDHHRDRPGCTEDEFTVRVDFPHIGPKVTCLHIEGDGWRVRP
jgi:hypothetical protein